METPTHLEEALKRLAAGTASKDDHEVVRLALVDGVVATGERAVAIGGNASDVNITTGDNNVVLSLKETDAASVHEILNSVAPTRLHELPSPPRDFTGREDELTELTARLEQGGITLSALHGLGGIGKTALALKLADQLTSQYPDAQFYLDLKGTSSNPLTVAEAMVHVIRAYHPTAKVPDIEAELNGLYRSVLQDQRALLLMDNAAGAEQVEPLIPPESCVLLVTSRLHFTLPGLFAKNLEALSPEDANKLLLTIAPRIDAQANEIARLCGYLPLALRLAASALMKFVNLTPADYLLRLRDSQSRLQLIEASLNLSYELLSDQLQKWWRLLAVFPDTFEERAAAAIWSLEVEQAQDALGELIAASMVEWDQATRRYRLHDLARVFADSRLSPEERAVGQNAHATHYQAVLAIAARLYLKGGPILRVGLILLDFEWMNIEAGQEWAEAEAEGNDPAAQLSIAYSCTGAEILNLRQHPRDQIRWFEVALNAVRRLKQRDREGTALSNLGNAYANLDKTRRAIEFYEQAALVHRELGDHMGEGHVLGNLGTAYKNLGETKQAIEFYEQAFLVHHETGDRKSEGHVLGNLGLVYSRVGKIRRAIECHQQSLNISREMGDRYGEGAALGNLGAAYAHLGESRRAIELHEQGLLVAREMGDRRSEGSELGNLAIAYAHLGDTKRAIELYEQRLAIAHETGDRRGEGGTLGNLGAAYADLGEIERAIGFYERALLINREIGERRAEGHALGNLGLAYARLGETTRAINLHEQYLAIAREIGERRGEGYALFNKSLALDQLGEHAQAIECAEQALNILEQIEDPNAAEVRAQLSAWRV